MTGLLICAAFILYIQLLRRAVDWLCCQPWWDRRITGR